MRKTAIITLVILLLSPLMAFSANDSSKAVATVSLIRTTTITEQQLNQKYSEYLAEIRASGSKEEITPLDVLNILVNDELVLQGAERDGYLISDSQIDQQVKQQKTYVEQQLGRAISDAEFEAIIRNNYRMDLATFKKKLKESSMVDQYVQGKMRNELENYEEPTEAQINEFFRANRSAFMNPELVRLSHIFMPFTDTDKASVKKEMDQVARYLRYDTYTFEELVPKYSKDKDSVERGGDIGWLAYDDEEMKEYLGSKFFEAVFALPLGRPSGILESSGGYHIVKVTTHTDPKLLSLTDPINPDSKTTVKTYIEQTLTNRSRQLAYVKAIEKLVQQLRDQSNITILLEE